MSNLSDRLKQLAYEKRISVRELERIMHVANGYVGGIGEMMGADKAKNILQKFPDVSRDWLLFGDGGMLRSISNTQIEDRNSNHHNLGNSITAEDGGTINISGECDLSKILDIVKMSQEALSRLTE